MAYRHTPYWHKGCGLVGGRVAANEERCLARVGCFEYFILLAEGDSMTRGNRPRIGCCAIIFSAVSQSCIFRRFCAGNPF